MAWIESHAELRDHPKTDLLMELLSTTRRDAIGLLHFVWWRALTYAPNGDLSSFTDSQLARWADWDNDPTLLVSALKTSGFLDERRQLHDWQDYAGRWIERRDADKARKRAAREAVRGTSDGRPAGRRPESGVPDLTGPDLTGPDRTVPPPQTPPARGRGRAAHAAEKTTNGTEPPSTEPMPDLVPLSDDDLAVLDRARLKLRDLMSSVNFERLVERLEPLGRSADGAWYLRAPPGEMIAARVKPPLARALFDENEAAGRMLTIVES